MHRALGEHIEGHLTQPQGVRESFSEQMILELHLKKEAEASQQDNLRNTTF